MKPKHAYLLFIVTLLLSGFFSFLPIAKTQETKKGSITFETNVIPFLELTENNGVFTFKWDNKTWKNTHYSPTYSFELTLSANQTGSKLVSLTNMLSTSKTAKCDVILKKKQDVAYEFGLAISNLEKTVAEKTENLMWQIINPSFSVKDIELEEIELLEEGYNITRIHLPANLVLSYEDLYKYGYTVEQKNVTHTLVKGVKGKTSWTLDPITYSSNTITTIGGTEGSPLDFEDLWDADKAGTLQLLDADVTTTDIRGLIRSDHTINGLNARKLTTETPVGIGIYPYLDGNATLLNGTWGARFWVRNSTGNETELTPTYPIAQVERSAVGKGYQSATWTCPETNLNSTDAIVGRLYLKVEGLFNWTIVQWENLDWITEQLGAYKLVGATWTIYYYTEIILNAGVYRYLIYTSVDEYYETRIENFQWIEEEDFTLTQQVRPTDEVALKLNLTITNLLISGNATINGLDKDGGTKSETITISANTTYTTALWWKSITNISCFGAYSIEVTQGQWGVVWKTGDTQFMFDSQIVLGNGTVAGTTWFADTSKQVLFKGTAISANYDYLMRISGSSHVRLGQLDDATEKIVSCGVTYIDSTTYIGTKLFQGLTGSELNIYGSHLSHPSASGSGVIDRFYGNFYLTTLDGVSVIGASSVTMYNILFLRSRSEGTIGYGVSGTFDRIYITENTYVWGSCFYFYSNKPSITVTNFEVKTINWKMFKMLSVTNDQYVVNGESPAWTFNWGGTSTAEVYRQYEFDLTVTYPNGTAVNGTSTGIRTVIRHYGNNSAVDYNATLNGDGTINQTILNMGFYNQTGGDSLYDYNPYNLTIYNATGFQTYTENFTLSEKTEWTIALTEDAAPTYTSAILIGALFIGVPVVALFLFWRHEK